MSRRRGHEVRNHARAVGYIRVSIKDQTLGPDAQRAALERWASARSVELVGVFEDRGVSGATALDRRPGLPSSSRSPALAFDSVRRAGRGGPPAGRQGERRQRRAPARSAAGRNWRGPGREGKRE